MFMALILHVDLHFLIEVIMGFPIFRFIKYIFTLYGNYKVTIILQ